MGLKSTGGSPYLCSPHTGAERIKALQGGLSGFHYPINTRTPAAQQLFDVVRCMPCGLHVRPAVQHMTSMVDAGCTIHPEPWREVRAQPAVQRLTCCADGMGQRCRGGVMASCLRVSAGEFWQQGLSTGRADSLDRLSEARLSGEQCCAASRAAKTVLWCHHMPPVLASSQPPLPVMRSWTVIVS